MSSLRSRAELVVTILFRVSDAASLERKGNGDRQIDRNGASVEGRGPVFPLGDRANRRAVEERVQAPEDPDGLDVAPLRDDGLEDADSLHPGLSCRLGIHRLHARDLDGLLDLAADPEGLLALLAEHSALSATEDASHDAARDAAF